MAPASTAFAGFQFPPGVILPAVRWCLRCGLSHRDLGELLAERGIEVDHVTLWFPALARTIVELLPGTHHETTQYANDRVEADRGRLKARLRPMHGHKRPFAASVVIRGHGFMQNLRRVGRCSEPSSRTGLLADAPQDLKMQLRLSASAGRRSGIGAGAARGR